MQRARVCQCASVAGAGEHALAMLAKRLHGCTMSMGQEVAPTRPPAARHTQEPAGGGATTPSALDADHALRSVLGR
jgi:hypothetical protein